MEKPNAPKTQNEFFEDVDTLDKNEKEIDKEAKKKEKQLQDEFNKNKPIGDILNSLLKKGQITEKYEILGIEWEIKLLNQDDLLEVHKTTNIKGYGDSFTSRFNSNIVETVCKSIVAIGGVKIENVFKDIDRNTYDTKDGYAMAVHDRLRQYLGGLAPDVIEELFNKYTDLNNRRTKEINELKKK